MKYYKMDFSTQTLTVSKEFAKAAIHDINSEEYRIMERCRQLCPNVKVTYYRNATKAKHSNKISYVKMENYIRLHENADELLRTFYLVQPVSRVQKSPYKFVHDWFMAQFPCYDEMPEIKNGKLCIPAVEVSKLITPALNAAA